MPYLLQNLVDGEQPFHQAVPSDYEPQEGEVLLSDVEYERNYGGVWDEATQTLREQTADEVFALEFEEAKTDKLVEFFIHGLEDVIATVPEAEGTYDRVPKELLDKAQVAHFLASAESRMGDSTKLDQMIQILGKLRVKRSTVGSMTPEANTIEDIEAEEW